MRLVRRMIQEHLEQLRARLEQATGLPEGARSELLGLVEAVRSDAGLGAQSDASSGDEPGGEATGLSKLIASVDELEASHPDIAASINQVANTLAKMGI